MVSTKMPHMRRFGNKCVRKMGTNPGTIVA